MRATFLLILFFSISQLAIANIDFSLYKLTYKKVEIKSSDKKIIKTLKTHYTEGNGVAYQFSKGLINDLASVIIRRNLLKKSNFKFLRKEGDMYWYSMQTYPTKYSFSVGRIDIAFKKNEKNKTLEIVGIEDYYDFNSKKIGGRPLIFELITRGLGKIIYRKKGTPFRMYYRAKEM